jgi:hypothetical protein
LHTIAESGIISQIKKFFLYNFKRTIDVERKILNMGNPSNTLKSVTRPQPARQSARQKAVKSQSTTKRSTSRFLLHFAQRHPFICLFAAWGAILYFGWLAARGLTYTNSAPLEAPKPQATATAPQSDSHIETPATSVGLLAIVAGSCALTSVVLAKRLRPVKSTPKTPVRRVAIQPKPAKARETTRSSRPPMSIPQANLPTPPTRQAAATAKAPIKQQQPTPTRIAEEESPFEMQDPSLAEMLDIRRQA